MNCMDSVKNICAIRDVIQEIIDASETHQLCQFIYFNLTKAFDLVDHNILMENLYYYGMRGVVYELIESYLCDRPQRVYWKRQWLKSEKVKMEVPEGSILGPLLFIVFVNDLELLDVSIYADDSSFLPCSNADSTLTRKVVEKIAQVEDRFTVNCFVVNTDNTHFLKVS